MTTNGKRILISMLTSIMLLAGCGSRPADSIEKTSPDGTLENQPEDIAADEEEPVIYGSSDVYSYGSYYSYIENGQVHTMLAVNGAYADSEITAIEISDIKVKDKVVHEDVKADMTSGISEYDIVVPAEDLIDASAADQSGISMIVSEYTQNSPDPVKSEEVMLYPFGRRYEKEESMWNPHEELSFQDVHVLISGESHMAGDDTVGCTIDITNLSSRYAVIKIDKDEGNSRPEDQYFITAPHCRTVGGMTFIGTDAVPENISDVIMHVEAYDYSTNEMLGEADKRLYTRMFVEEEDYYRKWFPEFSNKQEYAYGYASDVNYPLLLVSDETFAWDEETHAALSAEVYAVIDGELSLLGKISSSGTGTPIRYDGYYLYAAGPHYVEKYRFDVDEGVLIREEYAHVEYSTTGDTKWEHEINGETEDTEEAFKQAFAGMMEEYNTAYLCEFQSFTE